MLKRLLNTTTHRLFELPVLVLMPHSRCNCRCVMCDIWKANSQKQELSVEWVEGHLKTFQQLGVRRVALSGGEALMHPNLWKFCDALHTLPAKISLLSTGIALKNNAAEVVRNCDDVIVSLDGSREIHNTIRNIPSAYEKLEEGVNALHELNPGFKITGRTVLQKRNFKDFHGIVRAAKDLGLVQISFLAADVSSGAFNRPEVWGEEKISEVALSRKEVVEMEAVLRDAFVEFKQEFNSGFIAESREKIWDLVTYYKSLHGDTTFPKKKCNAPWVSAVVESNGDVLPCFFHKPYGNTHTQNFLKIVNSSKAVAFRKQLDVNVDPICQRCVCSLHVPLTMSVH